LVTALGTTYCDEEHGVALREKLSGEENKLDRDVFVDWYLRWMFEDRDSVASSAGAEDTDTVSKDQTPSAASTIWTAAAAAKASSSSTGGEETWKCAQCLVSNSNSSTHCAACEVCRPGCDDAGSKPSAAASPAMAPPPSTGAFTFGAPSAVSSTTPSSSLFGSAPITFGAASGSGDGDGSKTPGVSFGFT
ncbi:unnamed protein product, partial [Ectocarpus fasciculatus]